MEGLSREEQKELQEMVRSLHRQLIIGDESNNHKGFIKTTNERLSVLEGMEVLNSLETAHVKRVYSILSSWKSVLGVFVILVSFLIGIGTILKMLWDLLIHN